MFDKLQKKWKHGKIRCAFWNGVTFGLIGLVIELLTGLIVGLALRNWTSNWVGAGHKKLINHLQKKLLENIAANW